MRKVEDDESELLIKLSESIDPVIQEIDDVTENTEEEIGVFAIGGAIIEAEEGYQVHAFSTCAGVYSAVAEALYAELNDQLQSGDDKLFLLFRQVIRDLEEELNIQDGQPLASLRTLH